MHFKTISIAEQNESFACVKYIQAVESNILNTFEALLCTCVGKADNGKWGCMSSGLRKEMGNNYTLVYVDLYSRSVL